MQKDTHPPAAAAWRQVLPRLSGVSIWKPAHRTESLLRVQIMLYLCPERGWRHEEEGHRRKDAPNKTRRQPQWQTQERKRNTGIEGDKKKEREKEREDC